MTTITRIDVDGLERLRLTMAHAQAEIGDMATPLGLAARRTATRAAQLAPKKSGRLAASVRAGFVTKDSAAVTASVPYAGVQEYGWPSRHIYAQPFMRPGLAQTTADTVKDLHDHAQRALGTVEGA